MRQNLLPSVLPVAKVTGTARACGAQYGDLQAEAMRAFLQLEVTPDRKRLNYARRCWEHLRVWRKPVVEFVQGMAKGSGLTVEEVTLLLLHEEVFHMPHCTAFGATGGGTKDGNAIIGQNWDWSTALYPWSSLLRVQSSSAPATLTYAYPGLWASAGINEHGVSLVWTGACYFPRLPPRVGVPTYALIAGILTCATAAEAIKLLQRTAIAGHFIFFIADAGGAVFVVESVGGKLSIEACDEVIGRANHYECAAACKQAKQEVPPATAKATSAARAPRMAELLHQYRGRLDRAAAEAILRDHGGQDGINICVHPIPGRNGISVDSFYCLPAKRELWIARGHQCRHRYERHKV